MKRTVSNAFTRAARGCANPRGSLARSLCPLQAQLEPAEFGFRLQMSPMLAVDAAVAWTQCDAPPSDDPDGAAPEPPTDIPLILLLEADPRDWNGGRARESLATIAARLDIPVTECLGDDRLVLDDASFRRLLDIVDFRTLTAVRVDGPIEARDADAMAAAIERDHSPLDVELRAMGVLTVLENRLVIMQVRERARALALVAENLRQYLAALCNEPVDRFTALRPDELTAWLDGASALTIRPIETEVFTTSIDIGVSTSTDSELGPANRSLIYDLPSNSWHGEE